MKKSVIALALVLALGAGVAATGSARAWGNRGPGHGCGMMNGGYGMMGFSGRSDVNDADYKKFIEGTATLRKTIAVDQAEMEALMAGKDPDAKRVRELAASIVDNREKVAEIARAANITGPGGGFGCNGPGNCGGGGGCRGGNGPGFGPGNGPGNY